MRSQVRRHKDATLEELRARLEEHDALCVGISTVLRALIRLDLGRKKSLAASERNNYKRGWFGRPASLVNHRHLVFVDETAVNKAMTRRYGRAHRGERVHDSAPRNHGSHTSVIGTMGPRGLVATLAVEGVVYTVCFDAYLERVVGQRQRPGDVIMLDNLGAHWASRVEDVAERRGVGVLWLAPYSPDFGPIEQCRAKIKSYLRGAEARTSKEPDKAPAEAIGLVTREDIRSWLRLLVPMQLQTGVSCESCY